MYGLLRFQAEFWASQGATLSQIPHVLSGWILNDTEFAHVFGIFKVQPMCNETHFLSSADVLSS